jgi:RND family efflux transporter MFP subunit
MTITMRAGMITTSTKWWHAVSLAAILLSLACSPVHAGGGHDHGAGGHDDHGAHEEEEDRSTLVITHFSEQSELFLEFPALVANAPSRFLAHFTNLRDFSPVRAGTLTVTLSQGGAVKAGFRVREPARDGLFTPEVTPRDAGDYDLALTLKSTDLNVVHELGRVTVYPTEEAVPEMPEDDSGEVSYLKEQQWQGGFNLAVVRQQSLLASVSAPAKLVAPSDRFAILRAPSEGVVTAPGNGMPSIGDMVKRGQLLATLRARLGSGTDAATLRLAVERAAADQRLAQQNLDRLEELLQAGAIAAHRVNEAKSALRVASAELSTARARLQQLNRGGDESGVPLLAPIDGRIVDLRLVPGTFINADEILVQIAGGGPLWLRAEVAEVDTPRIETPTGAWFDLGHHREVLTASNSRLIGVGGLIDPVTRTLPVIFEFTPETHHPIRINQSVQAEVYTGEQVQGLAVPRGALIDDGGQPVVYVQTGGESFTRRPVRIGLRDQDWVEIRSGVEVGERVVSEGAYDVHLAAADPAEAGHGHAH